jgi:pectinesterase
MYKILLSIIIAGSPFMAMSQSTTGITGIPDTSFNMASAYENARKEHPDIKIATVPPSKAVLEKKDIVYCKAGKDLHMDGFYPAKKSTKGRPAILIIFGGGWRSGNRTMHYALARRLAMLGYVCYTPEYRLSTEALYPAAVHDLKSAIRWIHANAKKEQVDTSKLATLGFSAGGELAAFVGVTNNLSRFNGNECNETASSNVKAVVDIDGTLSFVHPESGEGNDTRSTSAATYWFGFPKKDNMALWEDASPLTHAGKETPPFLFLNSSVDRMHAGREDFIRILDKHGIYSEVHTFPGSPHAFCLFEPWFEPTVKYIDGFLTKVFSINK